jgi:hypothetical protein
VRGRRREDRVTANTPLPGALTDFPLGQSWRACSSICSELQSVRPFVPEDILPLSSRPKRFFAVEIMNDRRRRSSKAVYIERPKNRRTETVVRRV